jgi:predicted ABC-type transport system involved in lysophospholipase L1 biosynthesis ATPase subunit
MLNYPLNLDRVTLPLGTSWPAPLSLALAFNEVVLIEGAGPAVSSPLLEVAATLQTPVAGNVRHWGRDTALVRREKLYRLRRRIAYISPRQVLLHLLTLGENIALGPCYYQGCSASEALTPRTDLLGQLDLQPHLTHYPTQVSAAIYDRALWARELIKEPELILAVISGDLATTAGVAMLVTVLGEYLARYGAAALLLGESLEPFYPLGHRLFLLESGQLRKRTILEHRARPLTAYLPLV